MQRPLAPDDLTRVLRLVDALEYANATGTPLVLALDDVRDPIAPLSADSDLAAELHHARVVLESLRRHVVDVDVPTPATTTAPPRVCWAHDCGELVVLWWCPTHELERGPE